MNNYNKWFIVGFYSKYYCCLGIKPQQSIIIPDTFLIIKCIFFLSLIYSLLTHFPYLYLVQKVVLFWWKMTTWTFFGRNLTSIFYPIGAKGWCPKISSSLFFLARSWSRCCLHVQFMSAFLFWVVVICFGVLQTGNGPIIIFILQGCAVLTRKPLLFVHFTHSQLLKNQLMDFIKLSRNEICNENVHLLF